MSALRKCPFCGGEARPHAAHGLDYVRCTGCGACSPEFDDHAPGAIAAWDRRATTAEVEALRARVERLEADACLMALALAGQTPDGNTQDAAQATATQAQIDAAVERHLARAALEDRT